MSFLSLPINKFCHAFLSEELLHLHAHWLLQALYALAVTMDTVAQVGGGAGILCGAES